MNKVRFSLLAFGLAVATAALPATARPLDEVIESKVLHVVLYDDNEPFSWSADGETRGIDADIARAIAAKLGVEADLIVRMQGEKLDQDLRYNIVRGTPGGGIAGDIMLHVPVDREFSQTFREAVIGTPYFQQRVALAVRSDRATDVVSFDVFMPHTTGRSEKIGVQLGTVADYFLMRFDGGALVDNIAHYLKPAQGAARFASGETSAILGVQSSLQSLLKSRGESAKWLSPPMPGIVRSSWVLGSAVNERSRDLGHAVASALDALKADGTLKAICEKYGVTYLPPADP